MFDSYISGPGGPDIGTSDKRLRIQTTAISKVKFTKAEALTTLLVDLTRVFAVRYPTGNDISAGLELPKELRNALEKVERQSLARLTNQLHDPQWLYQTLKECADSLPVRGPGELDNAYRDFKTGNKRKEEGQASADSTQIFKKWKAWDGNATSPVTDDTKKSNR